MPDRPEGKTGGDAKDRCIIFSLQTADSRILASNGKEVSFSRAVLTIRHTCTAELIDVVPHATLGQEGGTVQDVSHVLSGTPVSFSPGGSVSWDVYDHLLPAHSGTASKIHMFGYRAALNWKFDLAVWAEYRPSADSPSVLTSVTRWVLRWSVPDPSTGNVVLAIEEGRE